MAAKKKTSGEDSKSRIVCKNRRAYHNFDIVDEIECGIVLTGSEVKSIRDNKISIEEAYARIDRGEVWLHSADVVEYPQATYLNHDRRRPRKLLLSRAQIRKFAETAEREGMTLIPLSVYFSRGLIKVQLAVAKGRKLHDKRERIKKHEADRSIRDAVRDRSSRR
jgi:SsrA-binding protein